MEEKMKNKLIKEDFLLVCINYLVMAILGWAMLEITSGYTSILHCGWFVIHQGLKNWLINIFVMASLLFFVGLFLKKCWIIDAAYLTLCFIFSCVNNYMCTLHGSAFSFADLKNIGTAANVISNYYFKIDSFLVLTSFVYLAGMALVIFKIRKNETVGHQSKAALPLHKTIIRKVIGIILLIAGYYISFFSPNALHPMRSMGGSYHIYGYPIAFVEMSYNTFYKIEKPANFDLEHTLNLEKELLNKVNKGTSEMQKMQPDIFLIVNETYYDLDQMDKIEKDKDPFDNLKSISGLDRGYGIVPGIGGGTNRTEYEVLTGNSLYLIPQDTPFNLLDMSNATSIVTELKRLGYHSIACHPKSALNYLRGKQYPAMGFDEVYFEEDFKGLYGIGGGKSTTDESVYQNVLSWYKENIERHEQPCFFYCLTYQNHGGYEQRDEEFDTVHILEDRGEMTDDINEYLTGIDYSNNAFENLVNKLRDYKRPVIVCMLGDHAPSFINTFENSTLDDELVKRKVPLLVWSNCGVNLSDINEKIISVNYICSYLLKVAGHHTKVPLYLYQQQIIQDVPIITSYGLFYTSDGKKYKYSDNVPLVSLVQDYFALEYKTLDQ